MKTQGVGTFSIAGTTARLPGRALLDSRDPDETTTVVGGLLSEHGQDARHEKAPLSRSRSALLRETETPARYEHVVASAHPSR